MKIHYYAAAALALCGLALSSTSHAQDAAPATVGGPTDHSRFVGNFAIGFLGFRTMNILDATGAADTVDAPVIGGRYWLDAGMGIDAGIGLVLAGGSTTTEGGGVSTDIDNPQPAAFILHGGLPLALADSQYFVFELVPELNVGLAGNTIETGAGDVVLRGFHLDVGARAGAEIHFGFIDIPQLSLQAGVGLTFSYDNTSVENEGTDTETSVSQTRLGTTVGNNPWDIFSASVAALYYFDD
jgi:hypothetical protein